MTKSVIKFWDKVIVVLLGIAGVFSSCNKPKPVYGVEVPEYPSLYKLNGIVSDKETSQPIPNIRIVRQYADTIYSDAEGKYISTGLSPEFYLKAEDIDGEANVGDFATKEIKVKFANDEFVKTQNIELEKKLPIPAYGVPQAPFKE